MVAWVVPLAITAGSALMQWLNSKQAQAATADERARVESMLKSIQSPQFDPKTLTPEDYKVVAKYVPQAATYIEEKAPEVVKLATEEAKMAKSAMRDALLRFQSAAGDTTLADIEKQQGLSDAASQARSTDASIRQEMQTRGLGGSGNELAARLIASQGAAQRAADTSANAVASAYRQKLAALAQSSDLASRMRNDEYQLEKGNVDIRNSFNARRAQALQDWENQRTGAINDASRYNTGVEQGVADRNVTTRNTYATTERDRLDQNAQRAYDNAMRKAGILTGQTDKKVDDIQSGAKDTSNTISGVSSGVMTGYDAYTADEKAKKKKKNYGGYTGSYGEEV